MSSLIRPWLCQSLNMIGPKRRSPLLPLPFREYLYNMSFEIILCSSHHPYLCTTCVLCRLLGNCHRLQQPSMGLRKTLRQDQSNELADGENAPQTPGVPDKFAIDDEGQHKVDSEGEKTDQIRPPSKKSVYQDLGWLDRLLALWILLAIIIGILLGNYVESVGPALQRGKFVQVSVPIGMMIPLA